jgi:Putative transposase of IS4/5 family (DUF4096)
VAETQRLLRVLEAAPAERAQRLHWSAWRRAHQATAQRCHVARRSQRTPPPTAPQAARVVAVPGTPLLTDALWARLRLLLPAPARRGRTPGDARPLLAGLLWLMHYGARWRAIPAAYGPWHTIYSRYQLWRRTGVWAQIVASLRDSTAAAPLT